MTKMKPSEVDEVQAQPERPASLTRRMGPIGPRSVQLVHAKASARIPLEDTASGDDFC